MKPTLAIIGAGGHGIAVSDTVIKQDKYNLIGFIDDVHKIGEKINGFPVISPIKDFLDKQPLNVASWMGVDYLFIAVGDNYSRKKIASKITHNYATIIHPSAIIGGGTKIGPGTFISANATVGARSTIGWHVIINTAANADHENIIWDYASLGPHACTGGRVCIGDCTAIGLNAVIQQQINIGKHSVIGSCSYVNKDIGNNLVAYGTPCKVVRERKIYEPYL